MTPDPDTLEPPVDPIEPAPEELPDAEPAPEPEPPAPPKNIMVPKYRFDEQTEKWRTAKRQAEEQAALVEELRNEKRVLYEKLFHGAEKQEQPLDPEVDPSGYARLLGRGVVELHDQVKSIRERDELQASLAAALPAAASTVNPEDPAAGQRELIQAAEHVFAARRAFHAHLGPEQAFHAARAEEMAFLADCRKRRVDPYLAVRDIARSMGLAPAPAAPAADPSLERRARAEKETAGLPKGGAPSDYATVDVSDYDAFVKAQADFMAKNKHLTGDRALEAWLDHAMKHGKRKT